MINADLIELVTEINISDRVIMINANLMQRVTELDINDIKQPH
ncbi:hypothetical protein QUF82_13110 [Thiotrichales bacterium HSG14]|nr:hypothetical protein [Thiotrichales bacterium HSG14]